MAFLPNQFLALGVLDDVDEEIDLGGCSFVRTVGPFFSSELDKDIHDSGVSRGLCRGKILVSEPDFSLESQTLELYEDGGRFFRS